MRVIFALLFFCVSYIFAQKAENTLKIGGSTTIQPIMETLSKRYFLEKNIAVEVAGGGSEDGIDRLKKSAINIATASRNLNEEEKAQFEHFTIGYDGLAFLINNSKSLKEISKRQILDIYGGKISNWASFGEKDEKMAVISKRTDRATLKVFEEYTGLLSPKRGVKGNNLIRPDAWEAAANMDVVMWVAGLPGSIGYVSLGEAKRYEKLSFPIKVLPVEGVEPTFENISNGKYPILRGLNILWKKGDKRAENFVSWLKKEENLNTLADFGFVKAAI